MNLVTGKELFVYAMDGIFMEVPQRMMMQSFIYMLMEKSDINAYIAVPVTALIWCISICIQCLIFKTKFDKSVLYELLSSFVFSMGVGTVLIKTEFIGFTMVAHFMERIASSEIRKRRLRMPKV